MVIDFNTFIFSKICFSLSANVFSGATVMSTSSPSVESWVTYFIKLKNSTTNPVNVTVSVQNAKSDKWTNALWTTHSKNKIFLQKHNTALGFDKKQEAHGPHRSPE
jgi:hypothetical protein